MRNPDYHTPIFTQLLSAPAPPPHPPHRLPISSMCNDRIVAPIVLHLPLYRSRDDPNVFHAEFIIVMLDCPTSTFTLQIASALPMSHTGTVGSSVSKSLPRKHVMLPLALATSSSTSPSFSAPSRVNRATPHRTSSSFFADELFMIARRSRGESINHELEVLVGEMRFILPRPTGGSARSEPATSTDTVSSATLLDDSASASTFYDTDSSEEPESDAEEEALIAGGFVVYE
uniref:Trihydroxynaphthalene reductase ) n=1 Tax=Ganoderma boninense TaxID=34458 RepID=A0A5K1K7R1_9APHY|nr:Trihydroxynaphthalene reductase (EC (T3HN reductase) [Ganoderma boninense]